MFCHISKLNVAIENVKSSSNGLEKMCTNPKRWPSCFLGQDCNPTQIVYNCNRNVWL